ncbi:MAG: hypothetical protein KDA65_01950 [Planctomycetaceae bacterium]|nr:hypothetical protein [Planctomycetaceae bacterium]
MLISKIPLFGKAQALPQNLLRNRKYLIRSSFVGLLVLAMYISYHHFSHVAREQAIHWIESKGGTVLPVEDTEPTLLERYLPFLSFKKQHDIVELVKVPLSDQEQAELGHHLRSLGPIEVLYLWGDGVDDEWMQQMGEQDQIKSLQLKQTNVQDGQVQQLLNWNQLKAFWNEQSPGISDEVTTELNQKLTERNQSRW